MSLRDDQRDPISKAIEELSNILNYDKDILYYFILMLRSKDELDKKDLAEISGLKSSRASEILQKMLDDGLIIQGVRKKGYLPLHPRLAISNLYRVALARDESIREKRPRVDAITAMLVKIFEER